MVKMIPVDARLPETPSVQYETTTATGLVSWSPDGSKLAFDCPRRARWADVFVVNADGSGLTQLTDDGYTGAPAWSPDGERLAVVTLDPVANVTALAIWTLRTSEHAASATPTSAPSSVDRTLTAGTVGVGHLDLGQVEEWQFAGAAGQAVRLEATAPAPFVRQAFAPLRELRDSGGRVVAREGYGGASYDGGLRPPEPRSKSGCRVPIRTG